MNIKEIALRLASEEGAMRQIRHKGIDCIEYHFETEEELTSFAEALVAKLAKENKPVVWYDGNKFYANEESASMGCADMANLNPLYLLPPQPSRSSRKQRRRLPSL